MIDTMERDIVATRRTIDGRSVIFTSTDIPPGSPLRFGAVTLDTGKGSHRTLVRLDAHTAADGWTIRQLVAVLQARMGLDADADADALAVSAALEGAEVLPEDAPPLPAISFDPGDLLSPHRWSVARCGALTLPFCPDPAGRGEGVTPEQILIILDQMLIDWARKSSCLKLIWAARHAVRDAMAAEVRRVQTARTNAPASISPG